MINITKLGYLSGIELYILHFLLQLLFPKLSPKLLLIMSSLPARCVADLQAVLLTCRVCLPKVCCLPARCVYLRVLFTCNMYS